MAKRTKRPTAEETGAPQNGAGLSAAFPDRQLDPHQTIGGINGTDATLTASALDEVDAYRLFLADAFRAAGVDADALTELTDKTANTRLRALLTSVSAIIQRPIDGDDTVVPPVAGRSGQYSRGIPGVDSYFEVERYKLLRRLGRGGMGEVWLARDAILKRDVALKVLRSDHTRTEAELARFVYEARATGRLGHPGVIPVHDAGELQDGRWFYTMEPYLAPRSQTR